ncbi:MEDS domain-containing protein [Streptomyces sp. H10-C2]|uniref:MEDS domain-containing protein n=1 Tax=unclassified Streptomyces TaxID=2593676 RepID=UPI0024BA54C0|nr:MULTISPECIES: MEDS domain-containing protein [unclassified Streptomyces]MDJ0346236.1 MEDS domain-containing protein [Streptomyces sp. PH10-H1]MDJ0371751.1 MEDS domain-containing protein [Streptomyces sp. H10-C2]
MPVWDEVHPATISVQRMRAGDHCFVGYGDDEENWDVLTTFAWTGLSRGEKVMVFAAPRIGDEELRSRLEADNPSMTLVRERGRLVLTSMRALIGPDRRFTPERQWQRIREETALAAEQGYTGLRAFIDMHWVPDRDADRDVMMHRESHSEHLFTDGSYSEVCAYDRRWFSEDVLAAMCRAHPRNLLTRLGELRAESADGSVRLIGEADLATGEQFTGAVSQALARTADSRQLIVDLTQLNFLSVRCADDLVGLVCDAGGHDRVEVRCEATQIRTLRALGEGRSARLVLTEAGGGC